MHRYDFRKDNLSLLSGSFLLVEVGELQSAMNVLILVASTSERCSLWVSTIYQAKVTKKQTTLPAAAPWLKKVFLFQSFSVIALLFLHEGE